MFKKLFLGLGALFILLLVVVAFKSPRYEISRQITIHEPPEEIFPLLNNQKLAEQWGPWMEIDPKLVMVHSGPEEGVGARSSWESSTRLGTGSATVIESIPNKKVTIRIEYTKPMSMIQESVYLVEPNGEGSIVTWTVTGENNFVGRLMCLFMDMDKEVGGMFERGLEKLKELSHKRG